MLSCPVVLGNQTAWEHGCGETCGCKYHTFDELQLGDARGRKVHVMMPEGYFSSNRAFPVLYMNDGNAVMFDGEAGKGSLSLQMHNAVHRAMSLHSRDSPQTGLIVVAVVPLDRDTEYTHIGLPGGGGGGLTEYAEFLSGLLVPFIDAQYRTIVHSRGRAIGGCSHGGLAAFLLACRMPQTFGAALCFSPSLWLGMDSTGDDCDLGTREFGLDTLTGDRHLRCGDDELMAFCHMRYSQMYEECRQTFGCPGDRIKRGSATWPFSGKGDILCYHRPRFYLDWGLLRVGGMQNMLTEAMATKRCIEMAELLVSEHGYRTQGSASGSISELLTVEDRQGGHDMLAWRFRLPFALKWLLTGINSDA